VFRRTEAARSSKPSVNFYQTTCVTCQKIALFSHCCENLRSEILFTQMLLDCNAWPYCFCVSDQYSPATSGLPLFLLYLSTGVDWDEEKGCFDSFCREIARFYSEQLHPDHWDTDHEGGVSQVTMPWAASMFVVAVVLYC
jgi:hypothetical protein